MCKKFILPLVLMLLCFVSNVTADEAVLGTDADTTMRDATPRGDLDHMDIGCGDYEFAGYLRFDLASADVGEIQDATLTLRTSGNGFRNDNVVEGRVSLYGMNNVAGNTPQDWDEATLSTADVGSEWSGTIPLDLSGGRLTNLDEDDGVNVDETVTLVGTNYWDPGAIIITITGQDLINFLQERVNDNGLVTFIYASDDNGNNRGYGVCTKEHATAEWHPQLALTYTPGAGPKLVYPVNEENVADYTPTLQWNAPEDYTPGHYYIYLDPNQANVKAVSKMVEPDPGSPLLVNVSQLGSEPNEYTVATELAHGERFYWKVEAYNAAEPNYYSSAVATFTTMPDEPIITQHPISQTVPKNSEVTLSVTAINATGYQWYKDGGSMGGETGSSLVIPKMTKANEGYYYCNVSNASVPEGIDTDTARLMVQRRVAWWNFDSQSINSDIEHPADPNEDYFTGTYFDPNDSSPDPEFNNTAPSPAGGYYMVFSGDTPESEDDNTGEAILASDPNFFNFYPQGFTASAWVKSNGPDSWITVVSKTDRLQTLDYPLGWALLQYPSANNYAMGLSVRETIGDWGDIIGTSNITDDNEDLDPVDTWHLVTGTYDGDVSRIYVDGNLENTSASSTVVMQPNIQPLVIGAETSVGYGPWDGQIDNVEIYNYALSRYDVAKLYTDRVTGAEICIEDVVGVEDMDFNDDCIVNLKDFAEFSSDWLDCSIVPTCIE